MGSPGESLQIGSGQTTRSNHCTYAKFGSGGLLGVFQEGSKGTGATLGVSLDEEGTLLVEDTKETLTYLANYGDMVWVGHSDFNNYAVLSWMGAEQGRYASTSNFMSALFVDGIKYLMPFKVAGACVQAVAVGEDYEKLVVAASSGGGFYSCSLSSLLSTEEGKTVTMAEAGSYKSPETEIMTGTHWLFSRNGKRGVTTRANNIGTKELPHYVCRRILASVSGDADGKVSVSAEGEDEAPISMPYTYNESHDANFDANTTYRCTVNFTAPALEATWLYCSDFFFSTADTLSEAHLKLEFSADVKGGLPYRWAQGTARDPVNDPAGNTSAADCFCTSTSTYKLTMVTNFDDGDIVLADITTERADTGEEKAVILRYATDSRVYTGNSNAMYYLFNSKCKATGRSPRVLNLHLGFFSDSLSLSVEVGYSTDSSRVGSIVDYLEPTGFNSYGFDLGNIYKPVYYRYTTGLPGVLADTDLLITTARNLTFDITSHDTLGRLSVPAIGTFGGKNYYNGVYQPAPNTTGGVKVTLFSKNLAYGDVPLVSGSGDLVESSATDCIPCAITMQAFRKVYENCAEYWVGDSDGTRLIDQFPFGAPSSTEGSLGYACAVLLTSRQLLWDQKMVSGPLVRSMGRFPCDIAGVALVEGILYDVKEMSFDSHYAKETTSDVPVTDAFGATSSFLFVHTQGGRWGAFSTEWYTFDAAAGSGGGAMVYYWAPELKTKEVVEHMSKELLNRYKMEAEIADRGDFYGICTGAY